ncbi:MAG: contractile injection system tape measure protein, partial [Cyclobacteriaceae bacterium]
LNETIVLTADETGPPSEEPWRPLIDTGVGLEAREFLIENWKGITRSFAGEIAHSLRRTVKNTDHIDYIIELLGDEKTEDLIAILEPYDAPVILAFKHQMLKINELESEMKYRRSDLSPTLNQLILGFILIDRGTRFNRKQFLKYQVFGLSQRLNVSLHDMIKFIKMGLEDQETNSQVSELITLLREILKDEFAVSYAVKELDLEEQMETLKKYLIKQSGDKESKYNRSKNKFFRTISKDIKLSRELIEFIINHADTVIRSVDQLDDETFLFLFEFLAKEKLSLRGSEKDELMNQLSHRLKKYTYPDFRQYLFSSLLNYKKLTRELIVLHDLDSAQNRSGSLTYSYFITLVNQDGKGVESVTENSTNQLLNQKIWKALGQTNDPFVSTGITPSKMVLQLVNKEGISPRLFTTLVSKDWEELANTFSETEWSQMSKHLVRFLVSHFKEFSLDMPHHLSKPMFLDLLPMVRQFLSEMHVKKSQIRKWNGIVGMDKQDKVLTSSRAPDQSIDYLELVSQTLETGRLPRGISIKSLSDKIIEWHSKGNKHFTRIIKSRILSLEVWLQLAKVFDANILLRMVQIYTGSQFNHFMSISKDTEYLLKRGLKDSRSKFDDNYTWAARLFLAQRVGTGRTRVEDLVQRHIVLLSGTSSQRHREIIDELVAGLRMVKKEIQPVSLRKRVDSILAMMQNTPEEVPEILSTTEEEIKAPLYISNAGIILLWPYLNMLLKRAGFLDEQGAFRDLDAKRKAVWFLQYVGSGNENEPEYACTLTKLLCGLPLESPLGRHIEISDGMKELSDDLLEAVILNWGELNNTSIDGLRNSFLVRNGSLEKDGSDWLLKVERKGFDVLLQTLPWSISNVKLPWMDGVIYVYWR